jgi:hypothetical protein
VQVAYPSLAHDDRPPLHPRLKVVDAQGQSLAYVYSRKHPADASTAGVLTEDEARRIASNIAKLPELLAGLTRPPLSATPL